MDIWRWVDQRAAELNLQGETELADWLSSIPRWVVDNDSGKVEAVIPAALARARTLADPWLQVFFGHWYLQYQVFVRHRALDVVNDAVSLLDLAHSEHAYDCPQSICATQDFAHCFGLRDGVGYAAERKAAAQETLARINPTWPCFACISNEYAMALIDEGDFAGALEYSQQQNTAMGGNSGRPADSELALAIEYSAIRLGQFGLAERVNRQGKWPAAGKTFTLHRRIHRAMILKGLNRLEEAQKSLPDVQSIQPYDRLHLRWAEAMMACAGDDIVVPAHIVATMDGMAGALGRNGVVGQAIELYFIVAELAGRNLDTSARRSALLAVHELRHSLRDPDRVLGRLASLGFI